MKIRLEVDLTPAELRQSFGLPDVAGIQEDLIQYVREKMASGVDIGEAISMAKSLVPDGMHAPARLQKMFGKAMSKLNGGDGKTTFKVNITEEDELDEGGEEHVAESSSKPPLKKASTRKTASKK